MTSRRPRPRRTLCALLLLAGSSGLLAQSLAEVETLGAATRGSAGAPRLALLGLPVVGDPGPGLVLLDGLPGATGQVLVGLTAGGAALPPYGATLWPGPPIVREMVVLDGDGRSPALHLGPDAVPPELAGVELWVQGFVVDPGAQGGLAFTEGRRMRFGAGRAAASIFRERYVYFSPQQVVHEGLALADLDGNGHVDVVTASGTGASLKVEVRRQLVDGSTAPALDHAVGGGALIDLDAGDVDGDGLLDVAGARLGSPSDSPAAVWLRGAGDGTLAPPVVLALDADPEALHVGDVTGDDVADLVVASGTSAGLRVFAGGPGGPGPVAVAELDLPAPVVVRGLELADVDGDGLADVVALSGGTTPQLLVVRALGGGAFAPAVPFPAGLDEASCLAVGDVDGDGALDVLVGGRAPFPSPQLVRLAGDGVGGLQASVVIDVALAGTPGADVIEIALADAVGDALPEVFVLSAQTQGGVVSTLVNVGGAFRPEALSTGARGSRLCVVDMEGDGRPDAVSLDLLYYPFGQWFAWYALGDDGTSVLFPRIPDFNTAQHQRLGDLDGDGRLDLVANKVLGAAMVGIALGDEDGFAAPTFVTVAGGARDVAVAEVDGDGRLDVVVTTAAGVTVFPGVGDGTLGEAQVLPIGQACDGVRIADLDGDGWVEIVAASTDFPFGGVLVLPALGEGAFGAPVLTDTASQAELLELADMDGDGLLDVVLQGSMGLRVLPGTGTPSFGPAVLVADDTPGSTSASLAVGDLDLDGDADVVRQTFSAQLQVWLNDGTGGLELAQWVWADAPRDLAIEDVNGDGAPDILCSGVMLGFGDGSFAPRVPGGAAGAVADFDGDGDPDTCDAGFVFLNRSF